MLSRVRSVLLVSLLLSAFISVASNIQVAHAGQVLFTFHVYPSSAGSILVGWGIGTLHDGDTANLAEGTTYQIGAIPASGSYAFSYWTYSGVSLTYPATTNSNWATVTTGITSGILAVSFNSAPPPSSAFTFYTCTSGVCPGPGGSITVTGVGTYTNGQTATLTPLVQYTITANAPSAAYVFDYWTCSGATLASQTNIQTQIIPSSGTTSNYLKANFKAAPTGFDFALSNSGSFSISPGGSGTVTITATLTGGITQSVALSHSGDPPSGVSITLAPPTVYPTGTATYSISTTSSVPLGTYQITIIGTSSGGVVRYTYFSVTIGAAGFDFALSANPSSLTVGQGSSATSTITVSQIAGSGSVALNILGAISGATMTRSPLSGTVPFTSTFTIITTSSAQPGTYSIRIRGDGGGVTHDLYITVTVQSTITTYSVTFTTNPSGGTFIVGGGSYASGTTLQLQAGSYGISASKTNYVFSSWTTTGGVSVTGGPSYTLSVLGAGTVTANFVAKATVTFTTSTGTGSITVSGVGTFTSGTSTLLSPGSYTLSPNVPSGGYTFGSFTPSGSVQMLSTYVMQVNGNGGVYATWIPPAPTFTITFYTSTHSGSITVDGVTYTNGISASIAQGSHAISASPPVGSSLISWSATGGVTAYGGVMSVGEAGTLTANFAAVDFPIAIITTPSDIGTITITGKGSYTNGGTASLGAGQWTVTATSSSSYQFTSWVFAGGANLVSPYTLTSNPCKVLIASPGSITAKFTLITAAYPVTFYTSTGSGTISVGGGTYVNGTSNIFLVGDYALSPSPPSGYTFGSFSAAGSVTMNSTYVMRVTGVGSVTVTWVAVIPPPTPTSQLDRVGIATYAPNILINGGFESSSLSPWWANEGITVSSAQAHSGSYSAFLPAPPSGAGSITIVMYQEPSAPQSLPVIVEAYFFNVQYPDPYPTCAHPFTQWTIVDTVDHVIEAGFSGAGAGPGITSGQIWFLPRSGYSQAWLPAKPANQWVHLKVEIYSNSFKAYVDDVEVSLNPTPGIPFVFTNIARIGLSASCSAKVYVDDVNIYNPQATQYVLATHARDSELAFISTYRASDAAWDSWSAINFGMTLVASDFSPSVTVSQNYVYLAFSDVDGAKYVTMSPIPNDWPPTYQWAAPTQLAGGATIAGMTIMYSESDGKIWLTYIDSNGKVNRGYFNDGHPELFTTWTTLSGITTGHAANFGRIDASGCLTIVASASDYNMYEWSCDSASWRRVTSGLSTNSTAALWVDPQTTASPSNVVWNVFMSPLSPATLYYGSTTVSVGAFPSAPIQSFNALCYSSIIGIGSTTSSSGNYRLAIVTSSYEVYIGKETSQTVTDWTNACGSGQPLQYWIKIPDLVPLGIPQRPLNVNPTTITSGWIFDHSTDDITAATAHFTIPKIASPYPGGCESGCDVGFWVGISDHTGNLVQGGVIASIGLFPQEQPFYETFYQIWKTGDDYPTIQGYSCGNIAQPGDEIEVYIYHDLNGWHVRVSDLSSTDESCGGSPLDGFYSYTFSNNHVEWISESSSGVEIPSFDSTYMEGDALVNGANYTIYDLYYTSALTHTQPSISYNGYPYIFVYAPSVPPPGFVIFNPKRPTLVFPLNEAIVAAPIVLQWTSVTEATQYVIYVSIFSGSPKIFSVPGTKSNTQTIMSYSVSASMLPPADATGRYWWAVEAIGPFGHNTGSPTTQNFYLSTAISTPPPPAPIKMTPTDNAHVTKHFTFKWQAVTGADKYRVILVDTQPSSVGSVCAYETTATSLDSTVFYNIMRTDAPFPHQFHWMVLAHNANGWTVVPQPYWAFTIDSAS